MATKHPLLSCHKCGSDAVYVPPLPTFSGINQSRLAHLLSSNEAPLEQDFLSLRDFVKTGETCVSELADRIATLKAAADALSETMKGLSRRVDELKPIMHPLRRVPDEVLSEIMRHSSNHYHDYRHSSLDPSGALWRIGQICSRWRNMSINTASLWSELRVVWPSDVSSASPQRRSFEYFLVQQIYRARSRLQAVTLYSKTQIPADDMALTIMFSTSPHWQKLTVVMPFGSFAQLAPLSGCLSSLERLDVYPFYPRPPTEGWKEASAAFTYLPKLRLVHGSARDLSKFALPFTQIEGHETFTVAVSRAKDDLNFLRQTPNLTMLRILKSAPSADISALNPVRLERLEECAMNEEVTGAVRQLLDHLTLPALINFRAAITLDVPYDSVRSFLLRSQSSLQDLFLRAPYLNPTQIRELLHLTPTLRNITLHCCNSLSPEFMQLFVPDDTQGPTSPNDIVTPALETLCLGTVIARTSEEVAEFSKYPQVADDDMLQTLTISRPGLKITIPDPAGLPKFPTS